MANQRTFRITLGTIQDQIYLPGGYYRQHQPTAAGRADGIERARRAYPFAPTRFVFDSGRHTDYPPFDEQGAFERAYRAALAQADPAFNNLPFE